MIHPRHRVPIAALLASASFAPAIGFLAFKGQAQATRNGAESLRQERLTTVTQDVLNNSCYTAKSIAKGIEVSIPDSVPASSCIRDRDRYGFLAITNGQLRILETFTTKEIQARKSDLMKGDPK